MILLFLFIQSNFFDKHINNKILGSFILCYQELIAVGNILDIKGLKNYKSNILLDRAEFILDYIKKINTSFYEKVHSSSHNKRLIIKMSLNF